DAARLCADEPKAGDFEPVAPAVIEPLQLSGLAVTTDHYLIVGRTQPRGLLVFDLRGGGAPLTLDWPAAVPFTPFDISAAADGGVLVLDNPPLLPHSIVHRYRLDGTRSAVALDAALNPPGGGASDSQPGALPLRGHDFAFVASEPLPSPPASVLYVAGADGN